MRTTEGSNGRRYIEKASIKCVVPQASGAAMRRRRTCDDATAIRPIRSQADSPLGIGSMPNRRGIDPQSVVQPETVSRLDSDRRGALHWWA